VTKLLALPFLLYQFERSSRAHWVLWAFLISCALLLAYSWIIFYLPAWQLTSAHGFDTTGVPVKSAIDQNQEFALCIFGLASLGLHAFRQKRHMLAALLWLLAAVFLVNILFVALARTSLIYMLVLAIMFALSHFERRTTLLVLAGLTVIAVLIGTASPYVRGRIAHIAVEYQEYRETDRPTSTGQRLTYWTQSIGWIREAPVIGHGTGSARQLFDHAAVGKEGAWGERIGNPHNQTLYVAIQWGLVGCIILYAMWYVHLSLFNTGGFAAWIGRIVVVENVFSSLLNSHLFDFSEGWIYVLGVGVAGGILRHSATDEAAPKVDANAT